MNIMELGAIGELVGGVAVIAMLIYLAVQIRQGNQAGAREAHRAWVSDMNRGLFEPQLSAEFNEVFQKANRDWDSIPPRDQARVSAVYSHMMNLFQEGFAQRERGETDEHLARQLDIVAPAAFQEEFRRFVEETISTQETQNLPAIHEVIPWFSADASAAEEA